MKHFNWPEKKADTLREAAFGYRDVKRLESEVCNYKDDPLLPCDVALKKIVALSEKYESDLIVYSSSPLSFYKWLGYLGFINGSIRMERTVYNLLRTRESLMRNCKEFSIPIDWMLDNGIISKVRSLSSSSQTLVELFSVE